MVEKQVGPFHIVSFDVEEHFRIEAASGLSCPSEMKTEYARRMDVTTRQLLEKLHERGVKASFFVVGDIARSNPGLVKAIANAGHDVASHTWDHRSVIRLNPRDFRADLLISKDALEQVIGGPVFGFRAPAFSIIRQTGWALDILAECG